MDTPQQTELLVGRAQEGDRAAFERLVELHQDALERFVAARSRLHLGPGLDTEDVVQETLARAYESLGRFRWRGEGSFAQWLCGIARHVLMKAARQAAKRDRAGALLLAPPSGVSPSRALRRQERLERLRRALAALRPEHRRVIQLARFEGLTVREVATRMGRSSDSVKHLLAAALRELRIRFGDTESLRLPEGDPGPAEEETDGHP